MSELYFNEVKHKLKNKGKVSAAWLQLASNVTAEIMADAGFDVLMIDVEHSPVDYQTILSMCQAIRGTGALPFARAPWNDMVALKRISDCGVMGISVPYVNTKEEAENAVKFLKYPNEGLRGIAGSPRAAGYGMNKGSYLQRANAENLVMCAIETPIGVANLDEILTIKELDGIFIGPMDLSSSMGYFGNPSAPEVQEVIKGIEQKVFASDKFLATVAGGFDQAKVLYDRGYNLIVMMSDAVALANMAASTVSKFKETYK
ncbi:MAG: HpcH/HpaI aldolase/citrate lyase family protein [Clostridia bacterium]